MSREVLVRDAEQLGGKLAAIAAGGTGKLHIVADFDQTLTAVDSNESNVRNSSWGVFESRTFNPEWFVSEYNALYRRYSPVLEDHARSIVERDALMHEWYEHTLALVQKRGLTKEDIARVAQSGIVRPREGLEEFLSLASDLRIPVIVFSAGIGDFIEEYLKHLGVFSDNIHVVSNFYLYNTSGSIDSYRGSIVHSLNKNEAHTDYDVRHRIEGRRNILLMGDFVHDVSMADGEKHDTVLSVGFLNGKEADKEMFLKAFDAVVTADGFEYPASVLNAVAGSGERTY